MLWGVRAAFAINNKLFCPPDYLFCYYVTYIHFINDKRDIRLISEVHLLMLKLAKADLLSLQVNP